MARGRKPTLWRYSAGSYPNTVEVCERTPGGMLYVRIYHPLKKDQVYRSLRHRDKERAKQYARDQADKLKSGIAPRDAITVGQLLALYLAHRTPEKDAKKGQEDDRRRAELWNRVLGSSTPVTDVTLAHWTAFKAARASGAIDARGRPVLPRDRRPVGPTAVAHDGRFIRAVFYWGMRWQVKGGGALLRASPFGAPGPGVKSAFELPKNKSPRRPIVSDARYRAVRAASERVLMQARPKETGATLVTLGRRKHGPRRTEGNNNRWMKRSYLRDLLDLSWETGRRRGAIIDLRYDDLVSGAVRESDGSVRRGIIAIRWRPTKHADDSQLVPVSSRARAVLEQILGERPGAGHMPLFPSVRHRDRPIAAEVVDSWLREAERIAGVPKQEGGLWHPYRRSWATRRKHLPDRDVARAGGWKTIAVMKESYQLADDQTLEVVVNEPMRLEERGNGHTEDNSARLNSTLALTAGRYCHAGVDRKFSELTQMCRRYDSRRVKSSREGNAGKCQSRVKTPNRTGS